MRALTFAQRADRRTKRKHAVTQSFCFARSGRIDAPDQTPLTHDETVQVLDIVSSQPITSASACDDHLGQQNSIINNRLDEGLF